MSRHLKSGLARSAQNRTPPAAAPDGAFVIYLCVIPAPVAVRQPQARALKPFRFFVSRCVIQGSEYFVLTMGYFATRAHAERWLRVVRITHREACVNRLRGPPTSRPAARMLAEEEVLRVLESRPPKSDVEPSETANAASSYVIQAQEAILSSRRVPVIVPPARRVAPLAKRVERAPIASRSSAPESPAQQSLPRKFQAQKTPAQKRDNLDEALESLARKALRLERDDTPSAAGVRHLSVEFSRSSKRLAKPRGARKS